MKEEIEKVILKLVNKAENTTASADAMRFAQAACNLANTLNGLNLVK